MGTQQHQGVAISRSNRDQAFPTWLMLAYVENTCYY